ncbi:hypothetical protein [Hyella patelloides]|nr:hypothetical protein [Hyella patelloides]
MFISWRDRFIIFSRSLSTPLRDLFTFWNSWECDRVPAPLRDRRCD